MDGVRNLPLFILSGFLLNITPGPDTFYILGRSIAQGRRAGVLSALGISCGCVVHTLAAALGLSVILSTSAGAFVALKLIGAAYLVYLGVRMWRDQSPSPEAPTAADRSNDWGLFWSGMLTNVLNPKVALFFLAFLPQFVDPAAPSKFAAFLFLGGVFIVNGTAWCLFLALAASTLSKRLRARSSFASAMKRATGAVFIALGIKLAVSK